MLYKLHFERMGNRLTYSLILFLSLFCLVPIAGNAVSQIGEIAFNPISSFDDLPSEEVNQIIQDQRGYLWIATNNGLCRYDGYRIQVYKDNLFNPGLLTDNAIKCIAEDYQHHLWIGTETGLNVFDLQTGVIRKVANEGLLNKEIAVIHVSKDNHLWVGTDEGLYHYDPKTGSWNLYREQEGLRIVGVKSVLEDSRGRLWIGTWAHGLIRYDREADTFISYPPFAGQNSAHVIFEDSRQNIWIGSWDQGLYRMLESESPETTRWKRYVHHPRNPMSLSDNMIYCMEEETETGTLWIGTRSGLSILDLTTEEDSFINYLPDNTERKLPYNELDALRRDTSGMMWLGMVGGGVYNANMRPTYFEPYPLESLKEKLFSNSVRSLFVDRDETLWISLGSHGLAIQQKQENEPVYYKELPEFKRQNISFHTVNHIMERKEADQILFGTWGDGLIVYDKTGGRVNISQFTTGNASWLQDNYIFYLKEDSRRNIWLGCRNGVSVYFPDGKGVNLNEYMDRDSILPGSTFYSIVESKDGFIWLGSNNGIIRVKGNPLYPDQMEFESYTSANGKLAYERIQCLFEDSRGFLWAGAYGGGLMLYDKEKEAFVQVTQLYGLLADDVYSILEDQQKDLWLGTNSGLIRLSLSDEGELLASRTYTTTDGLLNNTFIRNAAAKSGDGKLLVGGHNGYNSFYPNKIHDRQQETPITITGIYVFNTSWDQLPEAERQEISSESPDFTEKLRLNYKQNNFGIEFSSLSFVNPGKNKYAYKLTGYDKDWQYVGASNRRVNYNNLPAGTYKFLLKGTNGNGIWNDYNKQLQIEILPPPWQTGWAYLLYFILSLIVLSGVFAYIRARVRHRQEQRYYELELAKTQEVNHAKLQFFTNITHEFLTPLTILSASLDELRLRLPEEKQKFRVMYDNINRLIRLLQQILEFRKADTGNLRLKVAKGNISSFITKEVEAFRPLIEKKKMHLILHQPEKTIEGYFDAEKMDKIIYNLLSNALKYNREGGTIDVTFGVDPENRLLTFSVKDNGEGIAEEAVESLFKRFYQGNYRRFNTPGIGIGLSLTKDLVALHDGTIQVESIKGEGADFIVQLPIDRESYTEEQIDETQYITEIEQDLSVQEDYSEPLSQKEHTLLLVEDNEELLLLMARLLEREYTIHTATNGREALGMVQAEDIDLIVSDVMMPELDGVALCHILKGDIETSHIPVLLLTAKNKEEDKIEAYNSGADGFLSKPFNLALLHARIRNLLRKKERTARDFKKQLVFEAKELSYTSLDEEFLQRAVDSVHNHLDDPDFDQQQFADEMKTSKSTLYKKLKSLTGMNTSAFTRNIRLKAACRIMEERADVRISELAYFVGFNDPKYFSTCFKKEFGLQPTEYLERYHPSNNAEE